MLRLPRIRLALSLWLCLFLIPFGGGTVAGAIPRADSGVRVAPLKCRTDECLDYTSTVVSSTVNASHYGQSVTFTAVEVPIFCSPGCGTPTGSIDFNAGATSPLCSGAPLVSGRATCTVSNLAIGDHTINALYSGDWEFYDSEGSLVQTVRSTGTRAIMGSSSEISRFGQPVVFSAFVYGPLSGAIPVTGRFQFSVDGVDVGAPVTLNPDGRAFLHPIANLNVGPHWVGGKFLGNLSFRPSRPVRLFQNVQPAYTKTTVAVTPSGADAGETLVLRATVHASAPGSGSPDGTVQFYLDGVPVHALRTVSFGHSHLTLTHGVAPGAHTFRAVYAGSDSFFGSQSPVLSKIFSR